MAQASKGGFAVEGFDLIALYIVIAVVHHFADLCQFKKISCHSIFD
jgi:hypothetical protein